MLRVNEVKVSLEQALEKDLKGVIAKHLLIDAKNIVWYRIKKRALDARKKSNIHYKYNFDVSLSKNIEQKIKEKFNLQEVVNQEETLLKVSQNKTVVVVGSGPAGLFAAYTLSKSNVKVVLLERGENVYDRVKTVEKLLNSGELNSESNIQFGEGGAGTFSDGKLNTGINSPLVEKVLNIFYECGAEQNVTYDAKPHIGTDMLRNVVSNLRNKIIEQGGQVFFKSKFTHFKQCDDKIKVFYVSGEQKKEIIADDLILAVGYSARDTLRDLYGQGIDFAQKPFSVGYRIEHLQEDINKAQYGDGYSKLLPPADYKLFVHLPNGRTVYTFCMCPGGQVVPAISDSNQIVTNGMSYHARSGKNANSAILVSVDCVDYKSEHPLAGMVYQENLEKQAFEKGQGCFIVSKFGDFEKNKATINLGSVEPTIKPNFKLGNVYSLLPKELSNSIVEGIKLLGKKLKGFDNKDALLTGIETRSSAPFLIKRNIELATNIKHVYAVGEGAGMAGGIVSSAVDGMKIANKIINNYLEG